MKRLVYFMLALVSVTAGSACSCGDIHSSDILQRMESQYKYLPYRENPLFADGRSNRQPPDGVVPRERPVGYPGLQTGLINGQLVENVPLPITAELLERGQKRFNIVCATCHGLVGNGDSMVADNMPTRLPPSLIALSDKPAGFFYQAITLGYGLMPSFSGEIPVEERWAIVAYVKALQMSQNRHPKDLSKEEMSEVMGSK